jgi:alpha-1,3/alpha-1,6-mannosyltransferase
VFATAFPKIKREPRVVYPCVDISEGKGTIKTDEPLSLENDGKKIVLSINRFERKKNVALAVQAYALLPEQERKESRLVVAGRLPIPF